VLTDGLASEMNSNAVKYGAAGIFHKSRSSEMLVRAVESVMKGEIGTGSASPSLALENPQTNDSVEKTKKSRSTD
jgi:DNA-binding NarL/FixJ family response regulator